ncbi:hypothetical protein M595_3867 [Lyngbya aestuarii BL J]|uniref:Uncharacterized protein n=1 Tax=Lyngbya aestuarii BL J TaxID=1348334 RepID=U7QFT8_9CYAN|nr:hypothetical protein M595_3867 [Lyngbya aestuarii BL J]
MVEQGKPIKARSILPCFCNSLTSKVQLKNPGTSKKQILKRIFLNLGFYY